MRAFSAYVVSLGTVAVLMSGLVVAQTDTEMKRMDELDRICEAARTVKLAPLRAERIERCQREERRSRAECEMEYSHWGDTRTTAGGRARAGLFYDLPDCVSAFQARERYRR